LLRAVFFQDINPGDLLPWNVRSWRVDYNEYRPHSSLDNMTSEAFARSMAVEAKKPDY